MVISIIVIFITALLLGFPLAAINARCYYGKLITPGRVIFAVFWAFLFSLIITHLTLTLMDKQGGPGWVFYIAGLYLCIPYHMKSLLKVSDDREHIIDLLGIFSSISAYGIVVVFWSSFFSNSYKAGFLYDISSTIDSIF